MSTNGKSLVFDVRTHSADARIRRNILNVRSSITQEYGEIDQKSFNLRAGQSITISDLSFCVGVQIYSRLAIRVSGTVTDNGAVTVFPSQKILMMTTGVSGLTLENQNAEDTTVTVIRMSQAYQEYAQSLRLVTFAAFQNIAPLGFSVTTLSKVVAQTLGYEQLTNNQDLAPSTATVGLFRICDSDGTANPTGSYIMYLDQNVTDINASGNLKLWVGELS